SNQVGTALKENFKLQAPNPKKIPSSKFQPVSRERRCVAQICNLLYRRTVFCVRRGCAAPYTHLRHWSQLDHAQPIPPHPGPLPKEREDRRQSVGESPVLAMFEGRAVLLPLLGVRGNGSSNTPQHSK